MLCWPSIPCSGVAPDTKVWMARAEARSQTLAVPSALLVSTKRPQGSMASPVILPVWPAQEQAWMAA